MFMEENICPCCAKKKHQPRSEEEKRKLVNRVSRIEGQLKGIAKMIEEDRYCGDILIQLSAAEKALESFGYTILNAHLESCVKEDILAGKDEVIWETMELIKRLK